MKTTRLTYFLFNLMWCWASFVIPFFLLSFLNIEISVCIIFSAYFYMTDVKQQTDIDVLDDRIKELEKTLTINK